MIKIERTKIITSLDELENERQNFIEKVQNVQQRLKKITKIINKYPYNKRSIGLISYVLELEQATHQAYKETIKKGSITTSQSCIVGIIKNYKTAFELGIISEDEFNQISEELNQLYGKKQTSKAFIEKCRKEALSSIQKLDETSDILKGNIEAYFALYLDYNRFYNYDLSTEITDGVVGVRYSYFAAEDSFDETKNKIYESMHVLFKNHYTNSELLIGKPTKEEKERLNQEEDLINSSPFLQTEYENYKKLRKTGRAKEKLSPIEDFMAEEEFGKPKNVRVRHIYKMPY